MNNRLFEITSLLTRQSIQAKNKHNPYIQISRLNNTDNPIMNNQKNNYDLLYIHNYYPQNFLNFFYQNFIKKIICESINQILLSKSTYIIVVFVLSHY